MRPRRQHPRIRKAIKWCMMGGGPLLLALLFIAGIGSATESIGLCMLKGVELRVCRGGVYLERSMDSFNRSSPDQISAAWIEVLYGPDCRLGWWVRTRADTTWPYPSIPLWMIAAAIALLTAAAWRSHLIARRRAQTGYCPICNYDRVGLTPGSPCPECGKPLPPQSNQSSQWTRAMRSRHPRSRIRNAIKCGGLFATVLLVALMTWSGFCCVYGGISAMNCLWSVEHGCVLVSRFSSPGTAKLAPLVRPTRLRGFELNWSPRCSRDPSGTWTVRVPIWPMVVIAGLIAASAWRFDLLALRRERSGHRSKCTDDHTGLTPDSPCPECGFIPSPPPPAPL